MTGTETTGPEMTKDERPRPRYGEYAPIPPVSPAPPVTSTSVTATSETAGTPAQAHATTASPSVRPRRTWDIVLTTGLLLIGVYDVATSFPRFAALADILQQAYSQQGIGEFGSPALAASMGLAINIARTVVLVLAIVLSLRLISRNRIAFWVPLAGAVLAAVILVVCMVVVVLNDPAFTAYVSRMGAGG